MPVLNMALTSFGGLSDEGAQVHHVVGHRRVLGCVCVHNSA